MLPNFIETPAEFALRVKLGTTQESLVLDFKAQQDGIGAPEPARSKAQKELCRDIAQFANTFGGTLLIGVEEKGKAAAGLRIAGSLTPVKDVETLKGWIEQAITNHLVPSTLHYEVVPIETSGGGAVVAVNVRQSRYLAAVWDKKAIEYVCRTNHGKKYMNPTEVESHIMNGSRATRIAIEAAVSQATGAIGDHLHESGHSTAGHVLPVPVMIAGGVSQLLSGTGLARTFYTYVDLGNLAEHTFVLDMKPVDVKGTTMSLRLPYGVIREAWADDKHVHLLLSAARLVVRGNRPELIPNDA